MLMVMLKAVQKIPSILLLIFMFSCDEDSIPLVETPLLFQHTFDCELTANAAGATVSKDYFFDIAATPEVSSKIGKIKKIKIDSVVLEFFTPESDLIYSTIGNVTMCTMIPEQANPCYAPVITPAGFDYIPEFYGSMKAMAVFSSAERASLEKSLLKEKKIITSLRFTFNENQAEDLSSFDLNVKFYTRIISEE